MRITLTHNIIVNDGKRGIPRKSGEDLDVNDADGRILIANKQAIPFQPKQKVTA